MRTYSVSCMIDNRNFEFRCAAQSAADAIYAARAAYGPRLLVFGVRLVA